MNYFTELNLFDEYLQKHKLSTGQIVLWKALIFIINKNFWPEWTDINSKELEIRTGLSRYGIMNARKKLEQLGLIKTKSNNTKAVSYQLISLENLQTTTQDIQQVKCKKTADTTQDIQQDYAIFSTSLRNIFNKSTQYFQQVEPGTPLVSRGRTPPNYKLINYNNIYNNKLYKYKDYKQRIYNESLLESFYSNNKTREI